MTKGLKSSKAIGMELEPVLKSDYGGQVLSLANLINGWAKISLEKGEELDCWHNLDMCLKFQHWDLGTLAKGGETTPWWMDKIPGAKKW